MVREVPLVLAVQREKRVTPVPQELQASVALLGPLVLLENKGT